MKSILKKAAFTAAAAVAAVGIGIAPAAAATVSVSGGPSFTATSTNTVLTSGSITLSCTQASADGSINPGSYTTPAQIGTIANSSWGAPAGGSCSAFGASATVTQNGTWQLWATGAQSGGVTPGEIRNVNATVSVPSIGCTVTVTGTAPATWNNNTQTLTFTGGALTTSGSGFCLGLGSTGAMSGTFRVVTGISITQGAAGSVTVAGGPGGSGSLSYSSTSANSTVTSGSITIHCNTATASGSINPGSYTVPAQIGSVTSTTWSGCTAFGVPATVTQTGTWQLWATSVTSGGITPGRIPDTDATVSVPSLGCTVHVFGNADDRFDNASQTLSFTGGSTLTTLGTGFCIGLGSTGALTGAFKVSVPPSPIILL